MKKIKGFIFVSLMLFVGSIAYAEIYKWKDSSGGIHYGDTPQPGAQIMDIPGIQAPAAPNESRSTNNQPASDSNNQPAASPNKQTAYEKVVITQPLNEATIRNNEGSLLVQADVSPELGAGDLLQIVFDGKPFGKPQVSGNFALTNIDRGTHSIVVQVLDQEGNRVITSDPIKFFMHKASVNIIPQKRGRSRTYP